MQVFFRSVLLAAAALCVLPVRGTAAEPTPKEVFEERILPIFKSPNPSSCVECHLAGVDLKDYILPDAEKTFRSLRDQGLVDLKSPEKSKILVLINMGGDDKKNGPRVHEKARKAEYEAFRAWILACAKDDLLKAAPAIPEKERATPAVGNEVIRHARRDRVLESFEANVWAWRFRCMNCHTEGTPQNEKLKKEHGDRVAWVKKDGAKATLDYLIESRLVDVTNPEKSLLLTKPLGTVKHGGGTKFLVGDQAYRGFRSWIEDLAAIRTGKYARAGDLPKAEPAPERFGSELWLKLTDLPPEWGEKLLEVSVFAWDAAKSDWEKSPVATSDRAVAGKARLWQHTLTLLAEKGSPRAADWKQKGPSLPAGRYLVKLRLDRSGRLATNWKSSLTDDDFVGQIEFTANRFREGYGGMTAVSAKTLTK